MKRVVKVVKAEIVEIKQLKKDSRGWHWDVVMALCICTPVFIGALIDNLSFGLLSSFGVITILNLPKNVFFKISNYVGF